jgi:uncharacterized MAPEG superfamily protein
MTMSIPVFVALAFAAWTVVVLLASVGVYRWSRILTGRAGLAAFPADRPHGADWYRRAMRAHANCIENLPILLAIVAGIMASGASGPALDRLALVVIAARVPQTLVHVLAPETNLTVGIRFGFYIAQLVAMLAMIGIVVGRAL